MTETIDRGRIGVLEKIGQGGQGVVYRAPNVSCPYSKSMVFKEYHDGRAGQRNVLRSLNPAALQAMLEFLEGLPADECAKLIGIAAWPCGIVEDKGILRGFVMPSIPDQFFIDLSTAKGSSRVVAEIQHLLNDPQVLATRFAGRVITDREKYRLLHRVASALAFFHGHNVCVGDMSPKNLLFSLSGSPSVYFVDCDAMRVEGISLAPQLETPGWEVPAGEERATPESDRYKFGLLALRLLLGDQEVRDPRHLPSSTPAEVRRVITDTLKQPPDGRPSLVSWESVLDNAY